MMLNKENAQPSGGSGALATALRLFENRKQMPPIERVDHGSAQPLSYGQELLWLFQEIYPESTAYNLVHAFQLRGELNVLALEKTLNEIVRRHAILRTTYELSDEQPLHILFKGIHPLQNAFGLTAKCREMFRQRGDKIRGESLRLPVEVIQCQPAASQIVLIDKIDQQRGLSIPGRSGNKRQPSIQRLEQHI